MKSSDPVLEPALKAAQSMDFLEQHVRMVGYRQTERDELLRDLLVEMHVEVSNEDLREFGERFQHALRVHSGGFLFGSDFNSIVNREHGAEVVASAVRAVNEMGDRAVVKAPPRLAV